MIPPLVTQARELWSALPDMLQRGQQWLIDRGLLTREVSFGEAVQQAQRAGGSDAVGTVIGAVWGFVGGVFGLVTILILAFYSDARRRTLYAGLRAPVSARRAAACRRRVPPHLAPR